MSDSKGPCVISLPPDAELPEMGRLITADDMCALVDVEYDQLLDMI